MKSLLIFICICLAFTFMPYSFLVQNNTSAAPRQFSAEESIFLRSPTYSTYYNEKVYTLDSYDNFLKAYDTDTSSFETEYLSLEDYTVIDAQYLDNNLFVLASQDTNLMVLKIDIETKVLTTLSSTLISTHHNKLFVCKATLDAENLFVITLTNQANDQDVTPVILFANQADFSLNFKCKITFDTSQSSVLAVKNNLYQLIALASSETEIRLMFVHGSSVSFTHISTTTAKTETAQISSITPLYDALDNTIEEISISSVNVVNISETLHFAISFLEQTGQNKVQNTQIYKFNIGDGTNTYFEKKSYITVSNSPYILTNNEYLVYPEGQTVHYDKLLLNQGSYATEGDSVSNPQLEVAYFEDSNFVYKTAYASTALLDNPWDAEPIVEIAENADLIQIGTGSVSSNGYQIEDYVYCLYTANNKNYTGYVKLEDIRDKQPIDISEYRFKPTVTVFAGTKLYSLPTKVISSAAITTGTYPSVIKEIPANLKVQIVDTICEYTANNTTMVKVKVNNDVGYIDCAAVISPQERVDFLTTNAIVKCDGTKVYSSASTDSAVDDVLNKNKTIQIVGKRNAENGFTYVMYNDEYGNVLDGYIKTDNIETVSWTALQIVGCVLIAINVGLLILILVFKKRKIGSTGQEYHKHEKPNYKESAVTSNDEQ